MGLFKKLFKSKEKKEIKKFLVGERVPSSNKWEKDIKRIEKQLKKRLGG